MAEMKPMEVSIKPVNAKWEYKVVVLRVFVKIEDWLNDYGDDGWELVSVTPDAEDSYSIAYLKRIKDNG